MLTPAVLLQAILTAAVVPLGGIFPFKLKPEAQWEILSTEKFLGNAGLGTNLA